MCQLWQTVPRVVDGDVAAALTQAPDVLSASRACSLGDGMFRQSSGTVLGRALGLDTSQNLCADFPVPSVCKVSQTRDRTGTQTWRERFEWETQHKSWTWVLLFFSYPPPTVDKEGPSLLVKATFPLSQEQRCKAQPCKATSPLSGGRAIFYIYQHSKETASLAVCWQRQSTPFLYSPSPRMFTGTKHKCRPPVICLQTAFQRFASLW